MERYERCENIFFIDVVGHQEMWNIMRCGAMRCEEKWGDVKRYEMWGDVRTCG